jgi:hypothetical protein
MHWYLINNLPDLLEQYVLRRVQLVANESSCARFAYLIYVSYLMVRI